MSDHTSAGIFAELFAYLARNPGPSSRNFALWAWGKCRDYDFSPYQLECDTELIALGLAKEVPSTDPSDSPDTTTTVYLNAEGHFDE